ncbi:MAG: phage tail protein [Dehalococcoidia bacterium]
MSNPGTRLDPLAGFRFGVEISGVQHAHFTEFSGLQAQTEVFEYKEGGVNSYTHKLPVRTSYSNVTLKWGMTTSRELLDWFDRLVAKGSASLERKDVSIILYDSQHQQALRWNLIGAFPVKWSMPTLASANSEVPIESLELAFNEVQTLAGK